MIKVVHDRDEKLDSIEKVILDELERASPKARARAERLLTPQTMAEIGKASYLAILVSWTFIAMVEIRDDLKRIRQILEREAR
jgi:hypothetical protein